MARYMTAPLDLTIEELNIYQLIYKKADFNSWVSDYTLDQLSTDSHPALEISRKVASRIVKKLVKLGYIEIVRVGVKGKSTLYKIHKDCIYKDKQRNEYGMNRERIGHELVTNDEPIATSKGEQRNKSGMNRERIGHESGNPIIKSKKETEINKDIESNFEQVYSLFSRKGSKQDTLKNYVKCLKEHTHEELLQSVLKYNKTEHAQGSMPYQSNNFFGLKSYYKDYLPKPRVIKPINELTIEDIPPSFQHWERGKDVTLEAYNRGKLYAYKESLKDDN